MKLNSAFIETVLPDGRWYGRPFTGELPAGVVDSRLVTPGLFFAAVQGTREDGHLYIRDARARGAFLLIVEQEKLPMVCQELGVRSLDELSELSLFAVTGVLRSLIALARAWRAQLTIPIVGITGSVGKTSTKELMGSVLRTAGVSYIASQGNQNTVLGCALTLLRIRAEHQVAVLEMGISKRGEMALMAELVRPTIGVITQIAHNHLEGLGSLDDIAMEKRALFSYLRPDQIGIICGDQPVLAAISYPHPIIRFGLKMTNQIQARKINAQAGCTNCVIKIYQDRYPVLFPTDNITRVSHALAVVAISVCLHLDRGAILAGIQKPIVVAGRQQELRLRDMRGVMIHDAYNASPESMRAAFAAFELRQVSGKKIAVLGDMLELGVNSPFWHRQLGRMLRKAPSIKQVILVGNEVKWAARTMPDQVPYILTTNWQEAAQVLKQLLQTEQLSEYAVLVKGSRGMALDKLVAEFVEQ